MAGTGDLTRHETLRSTVGTAAAIAHHGELIQGVFKDDGGRLHRGLVTLPLAGLRSEASFARSDGDAIVVHPDHKVKAATAARLTLEFLKVDGGGVLTLQSSIPVGHGYGSSTADVVASIRAVAAALNIHLRPSSIGRLAVAAERASDAIAFDDHAVLFAQREGTVIENFGGSLPPLLLVGFKANDGVPVDTLQLPPARYDSAEIQEFGVLRAMVARAVRLQDPNLLGRAASASAVISQRHLPKQGLDEIAEIARRTGACGVQVAHSGSLFGLIFDLFTPNLKRRAALVAQQIRRAGFKDVEVHHVNAEGWTW
ncbi:MULTISPECIES: kinase [unclassified Mesorhizobium]|uniref:GHMP family kinase ATP-binding protein n=1 Tax=unclassified Mesorhizobium TaxID=325217 RepID=UPI001093AD22|nr:MULTISPECIES: kinase [unclassified Mesorhizobium]TGQ77319.1 kinase [Mesorhizobium sp. M8A.F.Ca.ET.207.01.1.1]TGU40029.1 kinase [bacterium M00.F.Ca.ET.156.01.1.1]TGQ89047.1 kinase [Mesorhizobium sp. M8A.F.Ca.ET.208.01.1.1]TGR32152.1 kinase [Mesorhizobium sp. M8A.F.Ca.ET.202.01.1.1]TGS39073.1 kinase [Mesorhizobium sp. M8A.F.Ca.ET.182.01.1.1]